MFVIVKKSVAGSTIVEVVTGVFLIALGMALTIVVFSKTMDNSNLYVRHQAVNAVNELVVRQTKTMNFIPSETDSADIRIKSSFASFPGNDSLQIVIWSASLISSGKELYTRRIIKKVGK
jgi:hypothetical protein